MKWDVWADVSILSTVKYGDYAVIVVFRKAESATTDWPIRRRQVHRRWFESPEHLFERAKKIAAKMVNEERRRLSLKGVVR